MKDFFRIESFKNHSQMHSYYVGLLCFISHKLHSIWNSLSTIFHLQALISYSVKNRGEAAYPAWWIQITWCIQVNFGHYNTNPAFYRIMYTLHKVVIYVFLTNENQYLENCKNQTLSHNGRSRISFAIGYKCHGNRKRGPSQLSESYSKLQICR